ncbi:putative epidermal cell surface receptor isoform X2 [Leptopilina boulardi]|uniref:putative epidermal cell surface receptor isoform X2 n=1 Tax=Leptopilina boulardi TaxID=63433 RepID=UPI0021F57B0E|nr:putative epidermal cell surface receptor isoform X2 [Leptopilina boulardi]
MRIQERWFLNAVVAVCFLGAVFCATDANTWTTTPVDDNIPGVEPLPTVPISESDTIARVVETKNEYPTKDADSKLLSIDSKKKAFDFKPKVEMKYPKPAKEESLVTEQYTNTETMETTTTIFETTFETTTEEQEMITMSEKLIESNKTDAIPILVQGIPNLVPKLNPVSSTEIPSTTKIISMSETTTKEEEISTTMETTSSRARALNISAPEPTNSLHANVTDLSDVSMDADDKEVEGGEYIAPENDTSINIFPTLIPIITICTEGNKTFAVGEKVTRGCDEKCICGEDGKIVDCKPMCTTPYVRAGKGIHDPLCEEKMIPEQPCCAIMVCAEDSATEPDETCIFGNKTLTRGQRVEDGCTRICICEEGGSLKCQPRCPPNDTTSGVTQHDRCVALTDPSDKCCTITLCDVTLEEHELKPENPAELSVNLTDVKVLNSTAIKLILSTKNPENVTIELSENNHVWRQVKPDKEGIVHGLEPAHSYYIRVIENGRVGHALHVSLLAEVIKTNVSEKGDKKSCNHRGKTYKIGEEWYDECISLCFCNASAVAECSTIQCPTDFGLDALDPNCIDWETVPPDFEAKPPHCCAQEVRCRSNGSCNYEGQNYENFSELPSNVTGCEKRCFCEIGNVTCSPACPPVTAQPPSNLPCPPYEAKLTHLPGDDCCMQWICSEAPGENMTSANLGSLAPDAISRPKLDDSKKSNNKSEMSRPIQEPERGIYPWQSPKKTQNSKPEHEIFHYPMDPGHPTIPYNGPYNPDYKPTDPSVEELFDLYPHSEKTAPPLKEKSKPKSDSKKPVDPVKPHKDTVEQFLGPFAPDKFPVNKRPKEEHPEEPQFIPLDTHDHSGPVFDFSPTNGENIPPDHFNSQFENPAVGPPYRGPGKIEHNDPNLVIAPPKKKDSSNDVKSKPTGTGIKPNQKNQVPNNSDDEQYHPFIHTLSQHPGLIQLDHGPPTGHQGLYDLHQKIVGQKNPPVNQIPPYFNGNNDPLPPKKGIKSQIFTQKNENGETTYHIHTSEIPNSPQQIEELLLSHISQNPNIGPFQHYPAQQGIPHNVAGHNSPSLPIHPDEHIPQSGLTHLNHPFAAQTPNQSGLEHGHHQVYPISGAPPGFTGPGGQQDEVSVQALEALDEHTVRLVFTVPGVLVGLHGRVELRYTSDKTNFEPATWKSQEFAPPDDLIATQQLEFELGDLKPSTVYKVKIIVKLQQLSNTPMSKIYTVKTLDKLPEVSTLPPQIPIDAELRIQEINSTWVNVNWKILSDYELQFIDGIQLRYKEPDSKIYITTPMIHRKVTNFEIENLKPSTNYEVQIIFIPFPGQTTELISDKKTHFTTYQEPDPYAFNIRVEINNIKSRDVEVSWNGVPYPEDKYVNIYRAIYQSDSGKEDTSVFKIAKRDSPAKTIVSELKPGTRYRLWIEVYLTNGKIKKSNVQDFITKAGVPLPSGVSGKLASIPLHEGDYYGPLVIVAIVASLAVLSTLILLMMLMKRRTSSKADISPRKTTSAYDNPSYKVELQQETMDL